MMNVVELQKILLHEYTLFTSEELVERMDKNDVASAVINKLGDIMDDPQVLNNESIVSTKKDDENSMQSPRSPARFSSTPSSPEYRFMPNLGEHSKEVLLEYGFSDEEINNLAKQNIISVR